MLRELDDGSRWDLTMDPNSSHGRGSNIPPLICPNCKLVWASFDGEPLWQSKCPGCQKVFWIVELVEQRTRFCFPAPANAIKSESMLWDSMRRASEGDSLALTELVMEAESSGAEGVQW